MSARDPGDEDRAGHEFLARILKLATARGAAPAPWDVLDFLWLAAHIAPGNRFVTAPAEDTRPAPPPAPPRPEPLPPEPLPPEPDDPDPDEPGAPGPDHLIPLHPKLPDPGPDTGPTISLPAPLVFPDTRALLQQWRPLMLRGPSRSRKRLDVAETARRWMDERILEIVERPTSERQIDLVLVLDFGPSMDMWRGLMRELAEAMRTSGGFRRVTPVGLVGGGTDARLLALKDVDDVSARPVRFDATAASGARLYLVVTDCVSAPWRGTGALGLLDDWAKHGSVALLQVLPERAWPRTALGRAETVQALTTGPLTPNCRLRVVQSAAAVLERLLAEEENDGTAASGKSVFPCASLLEAGGLVRTVQFLGGRSTAPVTSYRFRGDTEAPAALPAPDPVAALGSFTRRASRNARELATLLAAAPAISLPLARILREGFLRVKGPPLCESEIWTSGLLEPMEETARSDPEDVLYRYRAGVQQRLLDGAPRALRQQVIEVTSRYIARHLGRLHELAAMLARPAENQGKLPTGAGSDPMALVAAEVLKRQGGDLARLADSSVRRRTVGDLSTKAVRDLYGGERSCQRFAWSPDGTTLAIPTQGGVLTLRRLETGAEESVRVSAMGLNQAAWSPSGKWVAVACYNRAVRIFDAVTLNRRTELVGHNSDVTAVAFVPGGELLASGSAGGTVRLWNTSDGTVVALRHTEGVGGIRALHWLDGHTLAVGYSERTLIYRHDASQLVQVQSITAGGTALASLTRSRTGWLPRAQILILGQPNGQLQFWSTQSWQMVRSVYPHTGTVSSVDVSSDGRLIASKSRDGSVAVLRVSTGRVAASMRKRPTSSPYGSVAFRPGQPTLAVAQTDDDEGAEVPGDRSVFLYDLSSYVGTSPRKGMRVRVVGSQTSGDGFVRACREIGEQLGRRGHRLVISSASQHTADMPAFLGYVESVPYDGRVIFTRQNDPRSWGYLATLDGHIADRLGNRSQRHADVAVVLRDAFTYARIRDLFSSRLLTNGPSTNLALKPETWKTDLVHLVVAADRAGAISGVLEAAAKLLPGHALLAGWRDEYLGKHSPLHIEHESKENEVSTAAKRARGLHGVDAVIAIGGSTATAAVCRLAEGFGVPTVPIGAFGGSARRHGEGLGDPLPRWVLRAPVEPEEFVRICNSPWEPGAAERLVRFLERVPAGPGTTENLPHLVEVLIPRSRTIGILIHESLVVTLTQLEKPPADRVTVVSGAGTETPGRVQWVYPRSESGTDREYSLCVVQLEGPLERRGPFGEMESREDNELESSAIHVASLGTEPVRGVIDSITPDALEGWIESPRPLSLIGAPVLLDLKGDPAVVGLITTVNPNAPDRFRALRITLPASYLIDLERSYFGKPKPEPDTNAEPPKPEAPVLRWVCVAGTGTHDLTAPQLAASEMVGRVLADLSYGLVTGGWPGVDHVCARAFWERLHELRVPAPENRLVHVVLAEQGADFPHGQLVRVPHDEDTYSVSVGRSHAVVVIGGLGGTADVARVAAQQGVPVIALAGTGGDADVLGAEILRTWDDRFPPLPVSAREFERATRWPQRDPARLSDLLRSLPETRHLAHPLTRSVLRIERRIQVVDLEQQHGPFVATRGRHVLEPTPPFRLGIFLVRNIDFVRFVSAGAYRDRSLWSTRLTDTFVIQDHKTQGPASWQTDHFPAGRDHYPVSGVCYFEAEAYCRWLNRVHPGPTGWTWQLPGEDMWEFASRLRRGPQPTLYPWGNEFENNNCNSALVGIGDTVPVGSFPHGASPDGCADMAGNVWEFVRTVGSSSALCVMRGGSFKNNAEELRSSLRLWGVPPEHRALDFGFRCALVYTPSPA